MDNISFLNLQLIYSAHFEDLEVHNTLDYSFCYSKVYILYLSFQIYQVFGLTVYNEGGSLTSQIIYSCVIWLAKIFVFC